VVFQPAFAQTPISITVNTLADEPNSDGDCSLREAITAANTNAAVDACAAGVPGADTITFSVVGTITLGSTLPNIADHLTISGPGAASLTISGNNAVRVLIVNTGFTLNLQYLTIANGNASNDGLSLFSGGGILNNGTLTVSNSTFSNNRALAQGGGIDHSGNTLTVSNSSFFGNNAGSVGGGISKNGGPLTIISTTFSGNSAGFVGGGVSSHTASRLDVTNSTFSDNQANIGGGISNSAGMLTITNSTFAGNRAIVGELPGAAAGGGISNSDMLTIINSTLSGNRADNFGGGIANNIGTSTLRNTIVANNTALSGSNCSGAIIDGGGNLDSGSNCGFTAATSKSNGNAGLDPIGLRNNGGPTLTIALVAGSDAIDQAVDANCPGTDQRGVARPFAAHCDIGAFEFNTPLTPREGIEGLIDKVTALVTTGNLNQGQGNALIAKLEAAIQQLEHGNTKTAINQLQAFVNQMNALISAGTVPPAQGQPLIDAAQQIIAALGG
jgi:CSLREA domain-containing protein